MRNRNRKQPTGITLDQKNKENIWDSIDSFIAVLNKMRAGEWQWYLNTKCKYVDLRVDMRDGGCIIMIDDGTFTGKKIRIDPSDLEFQYQSDEEKARAKALHTTNGMVATGAFAPSDPNGEAPLHHA